MSSVRVGIRGMYEWYIQSLQRRPLTTKALTVALLSGASDLTCQHLEQSQTPLWLTDEQPSLASSPTTATRVMALSSSTTACPAIIQYNWRRTLQVCAVGLFWSGPAQHTWYNVLERLVGVRRGLGGLTARLLLDATVFTPIGLAGYFSCRGLLEGRDWHGIMDKLQTKWQPTLFTSWHFWPAANVVNFTLVPLQFRVLYWSFLSFFWQGYLTQTNES